MVTAAQAFGTLMTHLADIQRMTTTKDPDTGATKQSRQPVHTSVSCYLSQGRNGSGGNTSRDTGPNRIDYTAKVFFAPDADVLAGDLLVITIHGHTVQLVAGEPYPYSNHLEVPAKRSDAEA